MKVKAIVGFLAVVVLSWAVINPISIVAQGQVLESLEKDVKNLVESIKPSLVTIQTERVPLFPLVRKDRGRIRKSAPILVGSGIIYDKEGHILTTVSVIGKKQNFTVILPKGEEVEGKLVGVDPEHSLAVLKVDAKGLMPAKLGDSDKLKAGSWLTIVGNSYGLPAAVALGVMNGQREDGFIQMSANVSPGNSGGSVLNTRGEVVGLVAAKITEPLFVTSIEILRSRGEGVSVSPGQLDLPTSGVSLAIPINEIKEKADYIIKHGTIKKGYLGIYIDDLDREELEEYGIESGVMIDGVVGNTPADRAGLKEDDLVLSYDGRKVKDAQHLSKMIKKTRPNTEAKLKILRDGKEKFIEVTLKEAESRAFKGLEALKGLENIAWEELSEDYQKKLEEVHPELEKQLEKLEKQLERLKEKIEKLETKD